MRPLNANVLTGTDYSSINGTQIDANQLFSASFHAYFGDATAAGTFKLQVSNDLAPAAPLQQNFVVTNWVDLPTQTATITGGAPAILTVANMAYRWIRAVWTMTAAGVQTIQPVADVAGSLAGKYFLLQDATSQGHKYAVWFKVSSVGTAPVVAGYTAVEVDIANDDTAATIGAAIATAVAALNSTNSFTTAGTTTVTVTNKTAGPFVPAVDNNTGFTFAVTTGGSTTINVNLNALSI